MFSILCLIVVLVLIWLFTRMDHDLEVWFAINFGKRIENLKGKVVWITGASSGIGENLAYVMSSVGAKLVISGRNEEQLNRVKQQCVSIAQYDPDNVLVVPFDITNTDVHQEKLDIVLNHFKKLDILVNNAGKSQRAFFQDIEPDVDKALFDVNVFSLISLSRVVLRYFLEFNRDGQFAVTSSTAGIIGVPFSSSYTGSKHALHGYFECLRTELGTKGIAITMLCVGPVFSNIISGAFTGKLNEKCDTKHENNSKRMPTERCAYLAAVSIVNKIDQAWIAIQPVLTLHYFSQYFPQLARKLIPRFFSVERMNRLREGN